MDGQETHDPRSKVNSRIEGPTFELEKEFIIWEIIKKKYLTKREEIWIYVIVGIRLKDP